MEEAWVMDAKVDLAATAIIKILESLEPRGSLLRPEVLSKVGDCYCLLCGQKKGEFPCQCFSRLGDDE